MQAVSAVEDERLIHGGGDFAEGEGCVLGPIGDQGDGFGLGFAVALDTADGQISGSPGEHHWSGAATTHFWIDPAEDLAVVFMTQYMSQSPAYRYNIDRELRSIIYSALD